MMKFSSLRDYTIPLNLKNNPIKNNLSEENFRLQLQILLNTIIGIPNRND